MSYRWWLMSSNERQRIVGDTWYFPNLTNSGYRNGSLIDTGPDASVYEALNIEEVLVTHGHADHFSCAPTLRRAGSRVIAAREEVSLIENPEINIRGMFSWAKPSDEMVTKLFRGEGCYVDGYLDEWHNHGIKVVPLSGHTLGHSGFLTDDGVLFTGDALYIEELWAKHHLPYAIDTGLVRRSLELIRDIDFKWLVPSHGHPIDKERSEKDIDNHLKRIDEIESMIIDELAVPRTTEELIANVSARLELKENPAQYWLAVTTVKGFLGSLLEQHEIEFSIENHAGVWRNSA
jgi:glyoxylase-like metal-dependent hydrolase (beta-lactamase superfamily II)